MESILLDGGLKEVEVAENAERRLKLIDKSRNIIPCDWEILGKSGLDVLKIVRKNPSLDDIPFIMITSKGEKDSIKTAVLNQVSDYIVKPIDAKTLIKKIQINLNSN